MSNSFAASSIEELQQMSLEDLLNVKVTSVSKKEESASEAAAGIYVITQEDIRRSGMTTIPEVLRLAPGIQVSQINANQWAITSRGFNRQFSNKLLVLIDGRSVYTPLFSGVHWDLQDLILSDIERIEVIRGPGATLWGANAVNGVINIVTKNAKDTQGKLVNSLIGTEERGTLSFRQGGKADNNVYYRLYGKYFNRDDSKTLNNQDFGDAWYGYRSGFRADWNQSSKDTITLQGDIYSNRAEISAFLPSIQSSTPVETIDTQKDVGGNILLRWSHQRADADVMDVQVYVDYVSRNLPILNQERITFDVDFQHSLTYGERHDIVWGAGYRNIEDQTTNSLHLTYTPSSRNDHMLSAFIQDKISLVPNKVFLTVGSKFELNEYTNFEYQPNIRLSWLPSEKQTLWGAVSRAVRTPTRGEHSLDLLAAAIPANTLAPGTPAGFVTQDGGTYYESEDLVAYELGYRIQPSDKLSFDVAAFYNDYTNFRTFELGTPFSEPDIALPILIANHGHGETYGVELSSRWNISPNWQLSAGYTFLTMDMHLKDGSSDTTAEANEGKSPNHQLNIQSFMVLPYDLELSNSLYYVDNLSELNIPGYIRFDTRLGWKPYKGVTINLVGQNLFDEYHQEFSESLFSEPSQVGRSAYLQLLWRF